MLSSQVYSKSATQLYSSEELSEEVGLNVAAVYLLLLDFLLEQIDSLIKLFLAILNDLDPEPPTYVTVLGIYLKYKRNV